MACLGSDGSAFWSITVLVGIVIAARQIASTPIPVRSFVPLIALWYSLAVLYVILQQWIPRARWHAPLQIGCDLLMVTGVVYATGAQDSYFLSLYLLTILMASIVFTRRIVFLVAGVSFGLLCGMLTLTFYGFVPRTGNAVPMLRDAGFVAGQQLFRVFCGGVPG